MKPVDLNLFVIFDAIMREESMTAAAERLALTQPSVSNAVSRMRHAWGDPLFIKQGRGIKPTPTALKLWQQTRAPLETIRDAANKDQFNPATTKRTFRIAATDFAIDMLWLPLLKTLEKEAKDIDIHAVPYTMNSDVLKEARADLIIDIHLRSDTALNATRLFDNHYVCAMRHDHPLAGRAMDMNSFVNANHLLMSLSGEASGEVDRLLAMQGLKRRIACTVNHFSGIASLLINSNLITVIPRPAIEHAIRAKQLFVTAPPMSIAPAPISMIWHHRNNRDQGLKWLREKIVMLALQQRH